MKQHRTRPGTDQGFTLVELLVVLLVLAVLIAIAVPTYLGFTGRASSRAAQADVRTALTAAAAYHQQQDPGPSYAGMDLASLRAIDQGLSSSLVPLTNVTATTFCLGASVGGREWSVDQARDWYRSTDCSGSPVNP